MFSESSLSRPFLALAAALLFTVAPLFTAPAKTKTMLGSEVNSKYHELSPVLSPDGLTLFFVREADPRNRGFKNQSDDQDIWVSNRVEGGAWQPAIHIDAIFNSTAYDFPVGTSADGKTLYVGNIYEADGNISPGISKSRFINGKWTTPVPQVIINYYNYSHIVNYNLATDEKTLFLNVERKDTRGQMDLYVSFLIDENTWSAPLNIGDDVNTKNQEMTPFLASDMKTLYFASDRPGGAGGFDMYITRRLDESWQSWTKPENMGAKINTSKHDFSYVLTTGGETAIFSVQNDKTGKDLYMISVPKKLRPKRSLVFKGTASSANGEALEASIVYERLSDGKLLGRANSDPKDGSFKVALPEGEKYSIRADKEGFIPVTQLVDLSGKNARARSLDLVLHPLKKGAKIRLNSIFFKRRSASLTRSSFSELNRLVEMLVENKTMKIEVAGHTDSVGTKEYNQKLSEKRARAVRTYLVKKGIKKSRVVARGYGETKPVATNKTTIGKAKNRRVEFLILKK